MAVVFHRLGGILGENVILIAFCISGLIAAKNARSPIPWIAIGVIIMTMSYLGQYYYSSTMLSRNQIGFRIMVSSIIVVLSLLWGQSVYRKKKQSKQSKNDDSNTQIEKTDEEQIIKQGGWKCSKCGKTHYSYEFSCSCGASRSDVAKNEPVGITNDQPNATAKENCDPSSVEVETTKEDTFSATHRSACPSCGAQIPKDAKFCVNCGMKVVPSTVLNYCRFCGHTIQESNTFCPNCGKKLV